MKAFIKNLIKMNSNWTKWHHVMFVTKWTSGVPVYELLCRVNKETGLTQYRKVRVCGTVHNLKYELDKTIFHPELVEGENKGELILNVK